MLMRASPTQLMREHVASQVYLYERRRRARAPANATAARCSTLHRVSWNSHTCATQGTATMLRSRQVHVSSPAQLKQKARSTNCTRRTLVRRGPSYRQIGSQRSSSVAFVAAVNAGVAASAAASAAASVVAFAVVSAAASAAASIAAVAADGDPLAGSAAAAVAATVLAPAATVVAPVGRRALFGRQGNLVTTADYARG
eukprot:712323-Pleurochrysis_carterae.AAC.3